MVCSLVANKDNRVLDREYFRPGSAGYHLRNAPPGVRILFGQEYRPAFWGHSFLLGLREHLISPFAGNYEGTAIDSLYPPNADMFRKAKAQGGVVGYVHPFGDVDPLEGSGIGGTKAFPVDAALGTVDAQEWSGTGRGGLEVWRRLLNNDIALVPVGGEDSITDLHRIRTLGAVRTFVHVDREFSAAAWLDGLRKGRTFVSSGPLVEFRVNGKLPGESLRLPAAGGEVTLEAAVTSIAPLSKVAIHHRLGVLREIPLEASRKSARFRGTVRVADSDWLALVAEGPAFPSLDADSMLAITNAVRVYVGERKIRDRASAEYFLRWIERLNKEVAEWPWWNTQGEKDHVFGQIEEARRVYERLAAEARR